ncbi:T3JAM protein, partial [Peucedramus taeniatus]|nr:T3JAM protein [Peucedramus taeniatus]
PRRARPRPGESYEERSERRQEARERLRCRNNVTSCRPPARPAPQPDTSPRQNEFLRRRKLADPHQGTTPGHLVPFGVVIPPSQHLAGCSPLCHKALELLQPKQQIPVDLPRLLGIPLLPLTQSLPAGTAPALGLFGGDTDSSCPLVPAPEELPHVLPCSVPAEPQHAPGTRGLCPHPSPGPTDHVPIPQEALHRELLLKQKMVILQELLSTLLQASEKSWQGQLNEDKLRCKLRVLENQLQACTQSYSKECVKKILIEMEDQKQTYEQKAKEALQRMLEDKLLTEQQLHNTERNLAEMRENLSLWKEHNTTLKDELTKEITAHAELKNSFQALQSELQRAEAQSERLSRELRALRDERAELLQRASALRRDNDRQAGHIRHVQDKLQKEQEQKLTLEATISHLQNLIHNQNNQQKSQEVTVQRTDQVFSTQTPPLTPAKKKQNALSEHPEEEEEEGTESLKDEMQKRTSQLTAKENECSELRSELEALSQEYQSCLTRLRQCRDELNRSHGSQAQRQRGPWIPLLVAVAAVAIATFLASYR